MKLRSILTLSASLLGLLGIAAAVSLVWTTRLIDDMTLQLGDAIESVRAAEELEISLLQHEQEMEFRDGTSTEPPLAPPRTRDAILRWLHLVNLHVGSDAERDLVLQLRQRVEAYLAAPSRDRPQLLRGAVESAEALSNFNVTEAREARDRAERIAWFANLSGMGMAAVLLAGIGFVIAAARSRVYRPLIALRDAIAEYKRGNKAQRAAEGGPEELREIAAEFNEMATILADQQESQLRFIAGVAHDLKNPLHVLNMSALILARGEELPAGGQARQLLGQISKQAQRLSRMVEDLLDRTRIEAGALDLRKETCDLRELAAEVVELHRSTVEAHVLELAVPDEPVCVSCDPTRIAQVLTNLVNNAIKYSPDGGHVRVAIAADARHARITVADEGVGIPVDEREQIFEPFRRSDGTRASIPGIGLGLSVSRRIVRAHGGEIRVASATGPGATLVIELPLTGA